MKPNSGWLNDWGVDVNSEKKLLPLALLKIFDDFWTNQHLDEKSKTTKNRYANALHSLGGYLVEQSINFKNSNVKDCLFEYIGPDEGPLIHPDNENWQNQIDMVCRKLYKDLKKNR